MGLERDSRQEEELKLLLRTEFNYKLARERIRFKYEVLRPQVDALRAGKSVIEIPAGHVFDIELIEDRATSDPNAPKADGE
jgi:hypothetical protein